MSIEVSSNVVCKLGIGKMYKVFEKIKQYFEMEIGMIPKYVVYQP